MRHQALDAFGLFAVVAMMGFYFLERRGPWYVFGFACSCGLGSTYGFLQGAWPFGIAEGVWSLLAFDKFRRIVKLASTIPGGHRPSDP